MQYIEKRLLFGFNFNSEGKILAARIAECAVVEATKSVEAGAINEVLGRPWILNAENVRLKYFREIAQQVQNGDAAWAVKHFANPGVAIKTWFQECIGEIQDEEQYMQTRFWSVYKEKLTTIKAGILNETSFQEVINMAKKQIHASLNVHYECKQDVSKAAESDLRNFKKALEDELAAANNQVLEIPHFESLVHSKSVSERLGCTAHCKWCGALCWGEFGHETNSDDTSKHHSSHQIRGLHGIAYEGLGNLSVTKCNEKKDESFVYFEIGRASCRERV